MITTNLGDCFETKDGVLHVKRGLYETLEKEGIIFYGTPEELKPLDDRLKAFFKEDTPIETI